MGDYIKICYLKKLNNNRSIGLRGSSSVEYSTQSERTEMALKYCQSHKCHTYDTKDRKRGSKDNRTNQTRRRSNFYYLGGNACDTRCQQDWFDKFGEQALNHFGKIKEPIVQTEQNSWRKRKRYW